MPRENYEFDISPEQLAGLVIHASDLQGTADLIEGQIAGFLGNIDGDIGGPADLDGIARRNNDFAMGDPGHNGLNQNIVGLKGHKAVFGVEKFKLGIFGDRVSAVPGETWAVGHQIDIANRWGAASRTADRNVREYRGTDPKAYADLVETAARTHEAHENAISVVFDYTHGRIPGGLEGGAAVSRAHDAWERRNPGGSRTPPPDGAGGGGSIGPTELLWQTFANFRSFGGRIEPADEELSGSTSLRVPAIYRANDPTGETVSTAIGGFHWWGSELIDPDPNNA